ncbi:MAG: polysaccharide deacetylase family protein [Pseudomonas sp.]|uniref:polysaccharide deacetylase family protein n=1 Tax=Pseudomonas sp. TaxID=306 RepID=UPI00271D1BC9|nr:polysaccharide deacetylase family protein [Pseudomonas sp.]MDO9619187.1 polysaccharide deacetylase family protein [Pseudomonas sp.]MDP2444606.1 polysaccharide deacetylase family protein [Pseudomonas sp.]MDZ4334548.1 polysaccharide deacetylase family protein [Pseudomonas sp.]
MLLLSACSSLAPPKPNPEIEPIRFLLSFDDGPSASTTHNPTAQILDTLADNPIQPGIKALFFVQTRAAGAGGSMQGQALLRRQQREGHLLGFHTATSGHSNHRFLSAEALDQSLTDGVADLTALSGAAPRLVRPPFWNYDERTFAAYQAHGLRLLLTDLSANDGKTWGINGSLRRRSNLRDQLARAAQQISVGALPAVDGVIPVVVTFHDLNPYTARHMQEYLQILMDVAEDVGLATDKQPFYSQRDALQRAALRRALGDPLQYARLPGLWNWIWN